MYIYIYIEGLCFSDLDSCHRFEWIRFVSLTPWFMNSQALPERLPRLSPGACREANGVWCWGFVDGGNLQGSIYFP